MASRAALQRSYNTFAPLTSHFRSALRREARILPTHVRFLSSTSSSSRNGFFSRLQRLASLAVPSTPSNVNSTTSSEDSSEPQLQLSRLVQIARPEKGLIGLALAAQLVSASSFMLFPLALGKIVDTVNGAGAMDLDTLIVLMGGVFAVSAVASATRTSAMSLAGTRISRTLRVNLFHSILQQETAFFDRRQSGELVNRLSSDVPLVSRTLTQNLAAILRNGVTAGTSLSMIMYLSPKLALVTLSSIPPIVGSALIFGRSARGLSRRLVDALARATQVAAERIGAVRTVRTFGAEESESKRYAERVDETYDLARKVAIADGLYSGSIQFSAQVSLLGVLWFGGKMVMNAADPMTIGALTSFSMYAVNLGISLSSMGTAYGQLTRALGAGHRIFDIIDREPEGPSSTLVRRHKNFENEDIKRTLESGYDATVRFEDVSFAYPTQQDTPILRGVDLEVKPGEIVAVAGMSGSGKSTMSVLLSKLYEPMSGKVILGGTSLSELDTEWLRNQISVVAQEPVLFNGTISENIQYAVKEPVSFEEIQAAAKAAASDDMIQSLPEGYDTMVGERGSALSGGQRARTALCRALVRKPKVLVLDEHSAALDAESERAVARAVHNAARELNVAVLTIAHRTSSLRRADQVAVLKDGKVVELGTFAELMGRQSHLRHMLKPEA